MPLANSIPASRSVDWTKERIALLGTVEIKQLRANAERLNDPEIVGRCKELIIRSGFNVYPVEVEQVLCSHPDVVLAAVVGRAVPGNEEVIAFVEPVPGATLDLEALERFLRERLSPYKLPARIVPMPRLPASATGKIFKSKLREIAAGMGPAAAS